MYETHFPTTNVILDKHTFAHEGQANRTMYTFARVDQILNDQYDFWETLREISLRIETHKRKAHFCIQLFLNEMACNPKNLLVVFIWFTLMCSCTHCVRLIYRVRGEREGASCSIERLAFVISFIFNAPKNVLLFFLSSSHTPTHSKKFSMCRAVVSTQIIFYEILTHLTFN